MKKNTKETPDTFYKNHDSENKDAESFASKALSSINNFLNGLNKEGIETKEMAKSFYQMLEHKLNLNERSTPPSEEEVKAAINQLKDMGRFSVFASVSILPGGAFSLMGIEILAKKLGVKGFTFIPSSFRTESEKIKGSHKITDLENCDKDDFV